MEVRVTGHNFENPYPFDRSWGKIRNILIIRLSNNMCGSGLSIRETTDQIREIGKILKIEGQSLHGKVEKMQSNDRIVLSKLKKENFTLKTKIEELETDQEPEVLGLRSAAFPESEVMSLYHQEILPNLFHLGRHLLLQQYYVHIIA
jgi:hypothetical protein